MKDLCLVCLQNCERRLESLLRRESVRLLVVERDVGEWRVCEIFFRF